MHVIDVLKVPGIGPATIKLLNANGVATTYQLFGKYLLLKEANVGPIEHADRFYFWLVSMGTPKGFRAGIVKAVAEKLNITYVGLYDNSLYE